MLVHYRLSLHTVRMMFCSFYGRTLCLLGIGTVPGSSHRFGWSAVVHSLPWALLVASTMVRISEPYVFAIGHLVNRDPSQTRETYRDFSHFLGLR
jgi:hypothetical protein